MAKYTKKDIENLVKEIFAWTERHDLGMDFAVLYNGKMLHWHYAQQKNLEWDYEKEIVENVNPLDYCEWFPEQFIAGMCYDGEVYECINGYEGSAYANLEALLGKYNLYLEHCDSCHCAFVPIDDIEDYEYTEFVKEKPKWLYHTEDAPDQYIRSLMHIQFLMASAIGDKGPCTVGEHIEFRYKGTLYRMCMQTPYQGACSWQNTIPLVKSALEIFGATEIFVDYGRLD